MVSSNKSVKLITTKLDDAKVQFSGLVNTSSSPILSFRLSGGQGMV